MSKMTIPDLQDAIYVHLADGNMFESQLADELGCPLADVLMAVVYLRRGGWVEITNASNNDCLVRRVR